MIAIQILQHLLASIPLTEQMLKWSKREGIQVHRHIDRSVGFALLWLNAAVAIVEKISSRVYARLSNVLSVLPCGVFEPRESAVVILGDIDGTALLSPLEHSLTRSTSLGLGRAAALNFSELGYTVFVLSTTNSEPPSPTLSGKSSALPSVRSDSMCSALAPGPDKQSLGVASLCLAQEEGAISLSQLGHGGTHNAGYAFRDTADTCLRDRARVLPGPCTAALCPDRPASDFSRATQHEHTTAYAPAHQSH